MAIEQSTRPYIVLLSLSTSLGALWCIVPAALGCCTAKKSFTCCRRRCSRVSSARCILLTEKANIAVGVSLKSVIVAFAWMTTPSLFARHYRERQLLMPYANRTLAPEANCSVIFIAGFCGRRCATRTFRSTSSAP
jgi:hypothetical protein